MKRRNIIMAAPLAALPFAWSAQAQATTLRLVNSGGRNSDMIDAGYAKPFTAKTGAKVILEAPSSLGKLRAMVESKRITTHIFELGSSTLVQAKALNLLEKLDWNAIDPLRMFPETRDDYGMGYEYFSTLMTWRTGAPAPSSWVDFFDAQKFPGKRSLPDYPHYCLQFALLGDGVPMDKLFPLDVDRAFKKLEQFKQHVSVWWKTNTQPTQLMKDNEVQYAINWSAGLAETPEVQLTFKEGMYDCAWFTLPKGIDPAEKALAMKFLHEVTVPKNQQVASTIAPMSGNSPDLEALIGPEKFAVFPTAAKNKAAQFRQNGEWWGANGAEVGKRWTQFKLNA